MLRVVDAVLRFLIPATMPLVQLTPSSQLSGQTPQHRSWFRKEPVIWFNGFPGWPKLPLVQRLRASPSASAPVASSQPEEGEEEETTEDPEPLC
jgi:hypothetical protein